jgi:hypothetical protein
MLAGGVDVADSASNRLVRRLLSLRRLVPEPEERKHGTNGQETHSEPHSDLTNDESRSRRPRERNAVVGIVVPARHVGSHLAKAR